MMKKTGNIVLRCEYLRSEIRFGVLAFLGMDLRRENILADDCYSYLNAFFDIFLKYRGASREIF